MTALRTHTLVIGGTKGIGRAVVRALATEGHSLSVIGRRPLPEDIQSLPHVCYWSRDLVDKRGISQTLKEVVNQNGQVNNLIFLQRYRGSGNQWEGELETSLTATKDVIENLVDQFSKVEQGSIVIVCSVASQLVAEEQPASYHVAKAGIAQMVRYYAVALGPKGIRVNAVSPGTVLKDEAKEFYHQHAELGNLYKAITPLGRMGTPEDISGAISFLCSPKASFITGQNIVVDGGLSLQSQETLARKLMSLDHLSVTRESSERVR